MNGITAVTISSLQPERSSVPLCNKSLPCLSTSHRRSKTTKRSNYHKKNIVLITVANFKAFSSLRVGWPCAAIKSQGPKCGRHPPRSQVKNKIWWSLDHRSHGELENEVSPIPSNYATCAFCEIHPILYHFALRIFQLYRRRVQPGNGSGS